MRRRRLVATVVAAGATLAASNSLLAQTDACTPAATSKGDDMNESAPQTGYAPVNGLNMYYEVHGSGGVPVVLLHGAYMHTGMMEFLLSGLANTRQVIAVDLQ